jgi:hypothetical protein
MVALLCDSSTGLSAAISCTLSTGTWQQQQQQQQQDTMVPYSSIAGAPVVACY